MISLFHEHCGDDHCDRHRALAGPAPMIMFAAAMSTAMAFAPFAVSASILDREVQAQKLNSRQSQTTEDYMPVVLSSGRGSGNADLVFVQWPGRAFFPDEPDSPWAIVVRASGAVEIHGDRNRAAREWLQDTCYEGATLFDGHTRWNADGRLMSISIRVQFPPHMWGCISVDNVGCAEPWYTHTSWPEWTVEWGGDRVVKVVGSIPTQALAFWQEVASATPACVEAR